jgi:hypothetical protein
LSAEKNFRAAACLGSLGEATKTGFISLLYEYINYEHKSFIIPTPAMINNSAINIVYLGSNKL